MTNTSNVSDPFLATYERPTKGVVLGSLFMINHIFSLTSVAIFMWAGPVGGVLKKKFVDADRLLSVPCFFVAFINIVFTLNAASGFHKK